jgi:hypothetical protein
MVSCDAPVTDRVDGGARATGAAVDGLPTTACAGVPSIAYMQPAAPACIISERVLFPTWRNFIVWIFM